MPFGTSRKFEALCLIPPGNVARELALYRRELFRRHGIASALEGPEMAVLALGEAGFGDRAGIGEALRKAWVDLEGSFRTGGMVPCPGGFCLSLGGAFPDLVGRMEGLLPPLARSTLFDAGKGFFICGDRELGAEATERALHENPPPPLSFHAAEIVLFRLSLSEPRDGEARDGEAKGEALSWKEILLSHRPGNRHSATSL